MEKLLVSCVQPNSTTHGYETDISTKKEEARDDARVPCSYRNGLRPRHPPEASPCRESAPRGVIPVFPRRERLPRAQFAVALKTGRRLSSAHFMIVIPEEIRGYAVVIPKKVVRLASSRHLLKRRVLEALHTISLPPSLIVFPRLSASSVHYQDIKAELSRLISTTRV